MGDEDDDTELKGSSALNVPIEPFVNESETANKPGRMNHFHQVNARTKFTLNSRERWWR